MPFLKMKNLNAVTIKPILFFSIQTTHVVILQFNYFVFCHLAVHKRSCWIISINPSIFNIRLFLSAGSRGSAAANESAAHSLLQTI